ncbi:hypothetical protein OH77DRAFT_1542037 [Trametes cingulata]|nr:hypothetical protein OH77DRAFT_1542037 [Trametes cingulata]
MITILAYNPTPRKPVYCVHRLFNRTQRFMDAYRKELSGTQAAWACKQYSGGHRTLPSGTLEQLDSSFNPSI